MANPFDNVELAPMAIDERLEKLVGSTVAVVYYEKERIYWRVVGTLTRRTDEQIKAHQVCRYSVVDDIDYTGGPFEVGNVERIDEKYPTIRMKG